MIRLISFTLLTLSFITFSGFSATDKVVKNDTIMEMGGKMVTVNICSCNEKHENGCHSGGNMAKSCSISSSYYPCLGTIGGNCSVTCIDGYYACCGKHCSCIEIPKDKDKAEK